MPEEKTGPHLVNLGEDGGQKLKEFLNNIIYKRGISFDDFCSNAYKVKGFRINKPYDTIRKWFNKKPCVVRRDLLECILAEAGSTLINYPNLPKDELLRLNSISFSDIDNLLEKFEIVDLSYEIKSQPSCGFRLGGNLMEVEIIRGESQGINFSTTVISRLPTNYGTHIDFPGHIISTKSKSLICDIPLNRFILKAVIVDVRDLAQNEISRNLDMQNYFILNSLGNGVKGIESLFKNVGKLKITKELFLERCSESLKGKVVLFCTGIDKYWRYSIEPGWRYAYFFNPFLSNDLAEYLVDQDVVLVGSDSLQLECPLFNMSMEDDFIGIPEIKELIERYIQDYAPRLIHSILLDNSVFIVENLKGVDKILERQVLFIAVPLKLAHPYCVDNSPTRAFALIPKQIQ